MPPMTSHELFSSRASGTQIRTGKTSDLLEQLNVFDKMTT